MSYAANMAFAGGPFNHDETGRSPEAVQKAVENPKARALILHKGNPALMADGSLVKIRPIDLIGKNIFDPGPIYLGLDDGAPVFAASMADEADSFGGQFLNMRMAAANMSLPDLAIAGRARALLDWHFNHQFCAKCGKKSDAREGGLKRLCTFCHTEHFPRVNPVVIMLVQYGDKCLLGRGENWPDNAYSCLAGFISPGETVEEAVKREVWEETGVMTKNHRYVMSQPWPFPAQLMMGMICDAQGTDLNINTKEIEAANWYTRDQVAAVYDKTGTAFARLPKFTIAHHLLKYWLDNPGE